MSSTIKHNQIKIFFPKEKKKGICINICVSTLIYIYLFFYDVELTGISS